MPKGRPLHIKWQESERELYERYQAESNVVKRQKLQLLWLVRSGQTNRESCRIAAVKERTGQRYLRWYREGGVEQVLGRPHGGGHGYRRSLLSEEQQAAVKAEADVGQFKSVWDGIEWVKREYGVKYSYEGMRTLFKRRRLKKKVPRKQHNKGDEQAQIAWKKGG